MLPLAAVAQQTFTVSVSNSSKSVRNDEPVVINIAPYGDIRSALVTVDGQEIPCQLDDLNQDETFDELCFLVNLQGNEKKQYTVTLLTEGEPRPYPARVFAEMVLSNSKDKNLKKNQQNNYIESITARGDAAYTYNTMVSTSKASSTVSVSTSTNARHSTSMASSRNNWN